VVPRDFLLSEPKKSGGIIVKNVTLLLRIKEWHLLNDPNRTFDHARPDHLIGPEHDAVSKTGARNSPEVPIKILSRLRVNNDPDVHIDLRMRIQDSE